MVGQAALRSRLGPERLLISADVDQVDVPGVEGDFGVLAGHAPVMTTLKPGVLTIQAPGKAPERILRPWRLCRGHARTA